MSRPSERLHLTPQAYLEAEIVSEQRHEYVDGEVFAMSGGSDAHETICLNAATAIRQLVRDGGCRTYMSGMKVQVDETKYFYPDVFVTCEPNSPDNNYAKQAPKLIIEVLSPTTEAYDRGQKFAWYRQLPSLLEYVLINQHEALVEIFRREGDHWIFTACTPDNPSLRLTSIDWHGTLDDFYQDVLFLPDESSQRPELG